jgi:hypothetical protein
VPVDTSTGVFVAVPDTDVESGAALLPRTRREDPLHCSGGYLFYEWAPLSGNATTGGAGVAQDHFTGPILAIDTAQVGILCLGRW